MVFIYLNLTHKTIYSSADNLKIMQLLSKKLNIVFQIWGKLLSVMG